MTKQMPEFRCQHYDCRARATHAVLDCLPDDEIDAVCYKHTHKQFTGDFVVVTLKTALEMQKEMCLYPWELSKPRSGRRFGKRVYAASASSS